jgi:spermidine/putrescine transport system substrate-binding protein
MKKILILALLGLVILNAFGLPASVGAEGVVYFFNWSEYIPEDVLEQFTEETGIKVVYTTYDSNEALYAKLKLMDSGGYDLVVPSTYFVSKMSKEGMLYELDHSRLPNMSNLDPALMNRSYDPGNRYSIPYLWGSTGLGINTSVVDPAKVTSWADLWKPEFKGQVLLHNDVREVFDVALKVAGRPVNSTDPADIKKAYEKLTELLPNVRLFNSDSPKVPYLSGEVAVGMIWNGEAWSANEEDPAIRYVYPREGAILWADNLAIPAKAKNVGNAHTLLNFLLRPDVAKAIAEEVGYATPNIKALSLLDDELRQNRMVYPSAGDLRNAEFQTDIGEAVTIYNEYWEKLKTGR